MNDPGVWEREGVVLWDAEPRSNVGLRLGCSGLVPYDWNWDRNAAASLLVRPYWGRESKIEVSLLSENAIEEGRAIVGERCGRMSELCRRSK